MKKSHVVYIVEFVLPVLLATQSAFADTAANLKQAEGLCKVSQYVKAEQVYQAILQREPNNAESVYQAARMLPRVYLATDQLLKAQEAVQQLLAKSANHARLPHAIHQIVVQASGLDKTLQAGQIYQSILTAQPEHPQAVWLKMGIAIANAHLGHDQAVDSTLQNIVAQHGADERSAEALGQVAWAYRDLKQEEKARRVYQYVVDNWPKRDRTIFSQRGIVLCSIALDDQPAAAAGVQKLLADYADSKYMPEIVRSIAVEYSRKGRPEQARELHQYVVDKHPKSDEALWCQRDIAYHYIDTADANAAEAALQKIVTSFATNARLPEALADVGEHYRGKKDFANARNVHQEVVKRFPSSEEAILSQRNLILSNVGLNDDPQIQAGVETLLTQFTKDNDIAPVLCYVADRLGHWEIVERVKLYERIIDQYPKHEIVVRAKAKLGAIKIRQGDQTGGEAIFQKIMEDYASHPRLPEALHVMASGYYDRALELQNQNRKPPASEASPILQEPPQQVKESYAKAIEKWPILLQRYPRLASVSSMALYCSAVSYGAMGEPAKAVECYQTLLEQWPEEEWNQHVLLRLPDLYKQMVFKGVLSEQQARPLTKAAYEKLVQKYPDSPVAQIARERIRFYATPVEGQIHEP